ncbi:aldehyde dehydrogenase family protein [Candidatus Manganitrophus noduliformans]|uniref:Aldehyde dehydrogenase n=1 Tax=Candidatus Manganitrophus noduliformans TaxID=2606439 RepID=A0A7X6DQ39_9BACT|nr:aldehyde dehydrogenase [Candidatus Manganitrophus noduliformans]NKE71164.1 aldehyde dehydrogenase [Candidatus Manganitrophus noduliformans]
MSNVIDSKYNRRIRDTDRRRFKSLVLSNDRRKEQRRQRSVDIANEFNQKFLKPGGRHSRRTKERRGFLCPANIFPENSILREKEAIHGTIVNISSQGLAIALSSGADWLTSCNEVTITWGPSTVLSGRIIWKDFNSYYLNNGNSYLIGIELNKTANNKSTLRFSPPLEKNLTRIESISDIPSVDFYPLYIGGRDVDTGIYGFSADTAKLILNPSETLLNQETILNGSIPDNNFKSTYAAYCIAYDNYIDEAIDAAFNAWQEFRHTSIHKRKRLFYDFYDNIKNHRSQLIDLMVKEGHPLRLAEWEHAGMVKAYEPKTINFYLKQLFRKLGNDGDEQLFLARKPDGVVCVMPPGNAPCPNSLLAAFALLGGNTLIIKPPLRNPISTMYLWRKVIGDVLQSNKISPGVVNLIIGDSEGILKKWLASPKVSDIVYFGDSHTGLNIGSQIYSSGKKPILELSGNDTMVIWKDANLEGAADSLIEGFNGSMQICMVARRAVIHPAIYDQFQSIILDKIKKISAGLPDDKTSYLAPVGKIELFYEYLLDALRKGAQLIYGGTRINYAGSPDPSGIFITPTLITVEDIPIAETMKCTLEEGFFPLLTLINASDRSSKIESDDIIFSRIMTFLDQNTYGLRTSVWIESKRYMKKFIKSIQGSGIIRINLLHTGFSAFVGTHGGPKRSGGPFGELNYLWEKTTHLQGIALRE